MSKPTRISLLAALIVALVACSAQPTPLDEGKQALQAGDTPKAITILEKLIADEPGSAPAHILLAQAYLRAARKDDAQNQFNVGFTLDSNAGLVLDSQDAEEYLVVGNVYATLATKAQTTEQAQTRFTQALNAYSTTLKLDPKKAAAYTNTGVVYYQTSRLDDAIAQFEKALDLDPKDAETHYLLGAAYVQQQRTPEAEQEFNTALSLKPELAPAYIGLGNIYLLNKDYAKAVAVLEKATSLQADSPEALFALGQAYAGVGRNQDAIRIFNQFLQMNPPEPFRTKAQETLRQLGAP